MNKQKFKAACEKIINIERVQRPAMERARDGISGAAGSIGTLGEKTLHAVVKHYLEPDETRHEIRLGSSVADIINENGVFEIQTRGFYNLKKKLEKFLEISPVTVVYPLSKTRWIAWINEETGEVSRKTRSPKKGKIQDAVLELYRIREFLSHPNFRLLILFIDMEEYRYLDGWSKDKKRGSTRCDRIPVDVNGEVYFNSPADYSMLLPDGLPERFTSKDYKKEAGVILSIAQTALNILNSLGVVRRVEKQGNLLIYERE